MYGIDTLARDNRERVLSELSTTSIGGLSQIAKLTGQSNGRKDFAFEEFFFGEQEFYQSASIQAKMSNYNS